MPDHLRLPTSVRPKTPPQGFADLFYDSSLGQFVQRKSDGTTHGLRNPVVAPPASATAPGTAGEISYDSTYFYVCVAENTWRRAATATW